MRRSQKEAQSAEEPAVIETIDARNARVSALRDAYLAGTLDLTIQAECFGVERLLRDLFRPATARGRRR